MRSGVRRNRDLHECSGPKTARTATRYAGHFSGDSRTQRSILAHRTSFCTYRPVQKSGAFCQKQIAGHLGTTSEIVARLLRQMAHGDLVRIRRGMEGIAERPPLRVVDPQLPPSPKARRLAASVRCCGDGTGNDRMRSLASFPTCEHSPWAADSTDAPAGYRVRRAGL